MKIIKGIMTTLGCGLLLMLACSKHDQVGLLKSFETTFNSHNVESVMALIADDALFTIDNKTLSGKDAVRNRIVYDSVLEAQIEFTNIKQEGDSVLFDAREINEWLSLAGMDEYLYRNCVAVFEKGLLKRLVANTGERTLVNIGKVFQDMAGWIPDSLAFEINDLLQSGYSARTAERWKIVLQQWREDRMK
ncbi:MAG: nuclear transport factor 2 family protein [Candidatus Zixiibacteriota bacterium]